MLQLEWEFIISVFFFIVLLCIWACKKIIEDKPRPDRISSATRTSSSRQTKTKYRSSSASQSIQLKMCPECEATIHADQVVCPHCGASRSICSVCHHAIEHGDSVLSCPHCDARAHRVHILEYLKVKGTCPNCQADLDEFELRES